MSYFAVIAECLESVREMWRLSDGTLHVYAPGMPGNAERDRDPWNTSFVRMMGLSGSDAERLRKLDSSKPWYDETLRNITEMCTYSEYVFRSEAQADALQQLTFLSFVSPSNLDTEAVLHVIDIFHRTTWRRNEYPTDRITRIVRENDLAVLLNVDWVVLFGFYHPSIPRMILSSRSLHWLQQVCRPALTHPAFLIASNTDDLPVPEW